MRHYEDSITFPSSDIPFSIEGSVTNHFPSMLSCLIYSSLKSIGKTTVYVIEEFILRSDISAYADLLERAKPVPRQESHVPLQ